MHKLASLPKAEQQTVEFLVWRSGLISTISNNHETNVADTSVFFILKSQFSYLDYHLENFFFLLRSQDLILTMTMLTQGSLKLRRLVLNSEAPSLPSC